jgi:hypothetical protein
MTAALSRRLQALETLDSDHAKLLPSLVSDDTTDEELARLRKHGREVYKESDLEFIHLFV